MAHHSSSSVRSRSLSSRPEQALKDAGLYRRLRVLDGEQQAATSFDHRSVVNLSSNNYLGLTGDPRVKDAARS